MEERIENDAVRATEAIGYPVVVKPRVLASGIKALEKRQKVLDLARQVAAQSEALAQSQSHALGVELDAVGSAGNVTETPPRRRCGHARRSSAHAPAHGRDLLPPNVTPGPGGFGQLLVLHRDTHLGDEARLLLSLGIAPRHLPDSWPGEEERS
jgi:hypothetical protein